MWRRVERKERATAACLPVSQKVSSSCAVFLKFVPADLSSRDAKLGKNATTDRAVMAADFRIISVRARDALLAA